jgi:hypothetical protein
MIAARCASGLHPKSEIPDQHISDNRRLPIEWTTDL